jgi:membrane-associated phospholipid phosphatase
LDFVIEFGISATRWLQMTYPDMADVLRWIDQFGRIERYAVIIPLIYWLFNKRFGTHLLIVVTISALLNAVAQHLVQGARPFWLDETLCQAVMRPCTDAVQGFGVPDASVQMALVAFGFAALWFRRSWLWLVALAWASLMAVARLYLGVQFFHGAVLAVVLGFGVLIGYAVWMRWFNQRYKQRILGQRLLILLAALFVLLVLYVVGLLGIDRMGLNSAENDPLFSAAFEFNTQQVVITVAMLAAAGIGLTLERSRVRFIEQGHLWQLALRALVGLAGTFVLWRGLGFVFDVVTPDATLWLSLPLTFVRYVAVGLWMTYYAPWLFVLGQLADAKPQPEIVLTVSDRSLPPANT